MKGIIFCFCLLIVASQASDFNSTTWATCTKAVFNTSSYAVDAIKEVIDEKTVPNK